MTMKKAYFLFFFVFLLVCITHPNYAGKFQARGSVLYIFLSKSTYIPPASTLKVALCADLRTFNSAICHTKALSFVLLN